MCCDGVPLVGLILMMLVFRFVSSLLVNLLVGLFVSLMMCRVVKVGERWVI